MTLEPLAYYHSLLGGKFGSPRQSGLVPALRGEIVFTEKYRDANALRGLEQMSHVWLVWGFSENRPSSREWQPTVRPPRLGGNVALGVFATRSPYRPNPLGLSAVALERIETGTSRGPVLHVSGADLVDGTPIYDIKPYIRYADCIPAARSGFADAPPPQRLSIAVDGAVRLPFGPEETEALYGVLSLDPRPAYQDDPLRVYKLRFAGRELAFRVDGNQLTICSVD